MKALNERQQKFVIGWFNTGDRRAAARAAGYAESDRANTLTVSAYQVWHNPKVQAAIKEFAENSVLFSLLPGALAAFEVILKDANHKDYVKVAQLVLDRTGFHATMEHRVLHSNVDDRGALIKRLVELARAQGVDPRLVVGNLADVTDADFEMIPVTDFDLEDWI